MWNILVKNASWSHCSPHVSLSVLWLTRITSTINWNTLQLLRPEPLLPSHYFCIPFSRRFSIVLYSFLFVLYEAYTKQHNQSILPIGNGGHMHQGRGNRPGSCYSSVWLGTCKTRADQNCDCHFHFELTKWTFSSAIPLFQRQTKRFKNLLDKLWVRSHLQIPDNEYKFFDGPWYRKKPPLYMSRLRKQIYNQL